MHIVRISLILSNKRVLKLYLSSNRMYLDYNFKVLSLLSTNLILHISAARHSVRVIFQTLQGIIVEPRLYKKCLIVLNFTCILLLSIHSLRLLQYSNDISHLFELKCISFTSYEHQQYECI